jgi:hypothetical protein
MHIITFNGDHPRMLVDFSLYAAADTTVSAGGINVLGIAGNDGKAHYATSIFE